MLVTMLVTILVTIKVPVEVPVEVSVKVPVKTCLSYSETCRLSPGTYLLLPEDSLWSFPESAIGFPHVVEVSSVEEVPLEVGISPAGSFTNSWNPTSSESSVQSSGKDSGKELNKSSDQGLGKGSSSGSTVVQQILSLLQWYRL